MFHQPQEPIGWRILRQLLFDRNNLVTIKQQVGNPRNVVLVLKPKVKAGMQSDPATRVHLVGVLDPTHQEFQHLHVIRRNFGETDHAPASYLEAAKFSTFVMDFV